MKKLIFTIALAVPTFFFAQDTKKEEPKKCEVPANHKEPMKNGRLKKHVAIDNGVTEKDVIILQAQNSFGSGIYVLCVKGVEMKYKKVGSVFMREGTNPFEGMK